MDGNMDNIRHGMDVYGSDGEKIGTVAESNAGDAADNTTSGNMGVGGGSGVLGNESRVGRETGTSGGPGSLGNESRVDGGYGTSGGRASLGNETAATTDTSSAPYGSTSGGYGSSDATDADSMGGIDYIETETVVIEGVPAGSSYGSAPAATQARSTTGYMEVDHGGFLGIGAKALFVPYDAIQDVTEDRVTLNCTKDEAIQQYSNAG